jgi:predicted cupin superfamily sugar epimerase
LLASGERSHWHRIDAVEVWHYYAGAPLKLEVVDGSKEEIFRLGADIHAGEVPQVTVPARAWQSAESLGPWTLTGCTVAPVHSTDSNWRLSIGRRTANRGDNSCLRYLRPLLRMHAT